MAAFAEGEHMIIGSANNTAKIWAAGAGQELKTLAGQALKTLWVHRISKEEVGMQRIRW